MLVKRIQKRNIAELNGLSIPKLEKFLYLEYNVRVINHLEAITVLKLTSDGRYLFSGSEDTKITQFSLKKNKSKYIFSGHKSAITSLQEHDSILYSSDKQSIITWDLKTRLKLSQFQVSGSITSLAFIPMKKLLLASNKDGSVSIFQTSEVAQSSSFKLESIGSQINSLIISENSSNDEKFLIISAHLCGKVVIRTLDEKIVKILDSHKRRVNCLCSNSEVIVSGSDDKSLHVWRFQDFQFLSKLEGHSWAVTCCLLTQDGTIVSGSNDNSLIIWKKFVKVNVLKSDTWAFNSILCNLDCSLIYSAGDDSVIRIWDLNKRVFQSELTGHTKEITCFQFDFQGKFCVTGSKDKTVRVWKLCTSKQKRIFKGHEDIITAVKISNDCKWVICGLRDSTIWVWKLKSGINVSVLSIHYNYINSLAISPDNNYFVSSENRYDQIILWRFKRKKPVYVFYLNSKSLCFTPFSRYLISHSYFTWTILSLSLVRRIN
jgi:WD40 repeat protein